MLVNVFWGLRSSKPFFQSGGLLFSLKELSKLCYCTQCPSRTQSRGMQMIVFGFVFCWLITLGARGLYAPHPDGRPKADKTSEQHETNEMSEVLVCSFRSLRADRSFLQPSAGRLDGERVTSGTQGNWYCCP